MNRKNELLHENFRKTAALLRRNRVREFGNYPDTQNRVLSLLAFKDGISQRQLAYLLGIKPQSAGELLGKLEAGGMIRRQADETDGRVNLVFLTDEGRKSAEQLAAGIEKEDIFDCLSDEEKKQLEELLGKIVETHPLSEEELNRPRHGRNADKWKMFKNDFRFWFERDLKGEMDEAGPEGCPRPFEGEPEGGEVRPMPFYRDKSVWTKDLRDLPGEEEAEEI
ncbi:MAG: MarR family transcriptional regulator [Erysipelotrichaceae bacterium]|nr:MarR family transcriptional regulator [Erysipelotrichaceae bacterium]